MADLPTDTSVETIRALPAELLRHARDIDALFRRAHRDRHAMSAIIMALSAITDALGQFDPSPAAFASKPANRMNEKSENGPSSGIDHELSDALDRMPDLQIRQIFLRRLAELGYQTRPPGIDTK